MGLAVEWGKAAAFRGDNEEHDRSLTSSLMIGLQKNNYKVSQSQEEDEAALPRPTKKRVHHLRPPSELASSTPHLPDRRQLALPRSTTGDGQQPSASLEQAVSSSPPAASWETPLWCWEGRCCKLHPPIFEDVTYELGNEWDGASSKFDFSNGAFVIIRVFCHHCDTSLSQRVRH